MSLAAGPGARDTEFASHRSDRSSADNCTCNRNPLSSSASANTRDRAAALAFRDVRACEGRSNALRESPHTHLLKLLQRDVAEQIGADKMSISNWENGLTKPDLKYMPALIRFLGYNPMPLANGWADRLVQGRTAMGLTQKEAARQLRVDPSTLARWERGEREPTGTFAARASHFLAAIEKTWLSVVARSA